jgi:transposase
MQQYTMQSKYASYIAIDQHARSVTMRGLDLTTGESKVTQLTDCPRAEQIVDWALSWASKPVYFAYESGPCGHQLTREIRAFGHDCDMIAVSSIAKSSEDRCIKDDRRDSRRLLSEISALTPTVKAVWLPDEGCEAVRDLVRAYADAVSAAKRAKLQLSGFLLRHGHVWNSRTKSGRLKKTWTAAYLTWLKTISFTEKADEATFAYYRRFASEDIRRTEELAASCKAMTMLPRYRPYVEALSRLKGIDTVSALTFVVTIGDFGRFKNGRSVSKYLGLTPKRHDSGEKTGKNGHITKAGDTTCRRAVIEALSSLPRHTNANKALAKGQKLQSAAIEAEALKCNQRIIRRYRQLVANNKPVNIAKVAIASELVQHMWYIGCMVDAEVAGRQSVSSCDI